MYRRPDWIQELKSLARPGTNDEQRSEEASAEQHTRRVQALFETNNNALMRFLTGRLKSAQEAKEVAQEAYVRILQLDKIDGMSHMQASLFKVAGNLALNRLKSARRRTTIDAIRFFAESDVASSPEDEIAAAQLLEELIAAIECLPAKCRFAFVMHRLHGHELEEVAQLMTISERMVRIYVERATDFLRTQLLLLAGGRR